MMAGTRRPPSQQVTPPSIKKFVQAELPEDAAFKNVDVFVPGRAVECTEIANRRAGVCVVDVTVDVIRAVRLGMQAFGDGVRRFADRRQVVRFQQRQAFRFGNAFAGDGFIQNSCNF